MIATCQPARSSSSASAAPTRPQPTMTAFMLLLGHGLADHPNGARGVLQDVGNRAPDGEVAAEPAPEREPGDDEVGAALGRLVDDRRPDVAGLQQHGLHAVVAGLGGRLGDVEHALRVLGPAGDVGVERQRPVDLDDVDADELGLARASPSGREGARSAVGTSAGQRHHGAPKQRCRQGRRNRNTPSLGTTRRAEPAAGPTPSSRRVTIHRLRPGPAGAPGQRRAGRRAQRPRCRGGPFAGAGRSASSRR